MWVVWTVLAVVVVLAIIGFLTKGKAVPRSDVAKERRARRGFF